MAGNIVTQGDRAIRGPVARRLFGLDGQGIKIGIISDSFNAFAEAETDVRQGELPGLNNPAGYSRPVRVLRDFDIGTDEGRALAQIIHDVAPGAELLFHTTGNTEQEFAQAVQALTDAGADIIVDDILFATSTFFQDGIPAQAVDRAASRGVVFVSAAGNNGDRAYASSFRAGSTFSFRGSRYVAHDFDAGTGVDLFQDIQIPAGDAIDLILNWDQPTGEVETDFELLLLDQPQFPGTGSEVLVEGTLLQGRESDPSKRVSYVPTGSAETVYLLLARRLDSDATAADSVQWISFANDSDSRTQYQYVTDGPERGNTVYGHQNAAGAIAVGAVPFNQTTTLESYSSTGGVPILFDAQGDRLSAPEQRQKPNILGPDRVATSMASFRSFAGTSAAAPHIAAVAALMLQRAGGRGQLTLDQLLAALQSDTIPLASPPDNFPAGVGVVQADAAVLGAAADITGTQGDDRLVGTNAAENLSGDTGHDRLQGRGGFDALVGDTGADTLRGGQGNDYLLGHLGADRLVGGTGRDWLQAGDGADFLAGGRGPDVLKGGRGRDTLHGGQGTNQLTGGGGRDRFVLKSNGRMNISDFQDRRDRLGLPTGMEFGQLSIEQASNSTLISGFDRVLASLSGIAADRITRADFISV
jgi:subtilisin family serine protease